MELYEKCRDGGTLLCLDFPKGGAFSIDNNAWTIGERFRGLKMIPTLSDGSPIHFVTVSAAPQAISRTGLFLRFSRGQVRILRWDIVHEIARLVLPTDPEHDRLVDAVRRFEFDAGLAPFPSSPESLGKEWEGLCSLIDENTLTRCCIPVGTVVLPGEFHDENSPKKDTSVVTTPLSGANEAHFSNISKFRAQAKEKVFNKTNVKVSGRDLTCLHLDGSSTLNEMLSSISHSKSVGEKQVLAELQLAFITFINISSVAGFEQWKKLVLLLTSCDEKYLECPEFFIDLINVLHSQLSSEAFPLDFFENELTGKSENFFQAALSSLFQIVLVDTESEVENECFENVQRSAKRLKRFVKRKFGISIDVTAEAATVVDFQKFSKASVTQLKEGKRQRNDLISQRMSWMVEPRETIDLLWAAIQYLCLKRIITPLISLRCVKNNTCVHALFTDGTSEMLTRNVLDAHLPRKGHNLGPECLKQQGQVSLSSFDLAKLAIGWLRADVFALFEDMELLISDDATMFGSNGSKEALDFKRKWLTEQKNYTVGSIVEIDTANQSVVATFDCLLPGKEGRGTDVIRFNKNGKVVKVGAIRHN